MNIVHISGEAAPFIQTGGLGTFLEKLPAAQAALGHSVKVCLPMYLLVDKSITEIIDTGVRINVSAGEEELVYEVHQAFNLGVEYLFFYNSEMFSRGGVYGSGDFDYSDNDLRYGTFSQACLFYFADNAFKPDVFHCHDWQAGLVPLYSSLMFKDKNWRNVFTIHDVSFQGLFRRMDIEELNLPWEVYGIEGIEFYGQISFLKAGIVYSDMITTVSPAYAEDIQSDGFADGMEGVIAKYSYKLKGILNGIDYNIWNPRSDLYISHQYSEGYADWKKDCKKDLLPEFDIDPEKPLFVMIGRMSNRKGLELVFDAALELSGKPACFFILGHGDKTYARIIRKLADSYQNFFIHTKYDHALAHRLFAAADFILAPSFYEPFGSSHLIGARYGAVPLVNPTGGVVNTVKSYADNGCAIIMDEYTVTELLLKVDEALELYREGNLAEKVLNSECCGDYSWERAAAQYIEIYQSPDGGGA
jgi:starch synthase